MTTEPDHDWKVLEIDRCSYRVMGEIMYAVLNTGATIIDTYVNDRRCMLLNSHWTSGQILVKIPRRRLVESLVHPTNIDFFTKIRGVTVKDPPKLEISTGRLL